MFKIKQDYDDHWVITLESTGEEVAEISTSHSWVGNSRTKQLKANDKIVSNIKNQKEALVKLEQFFKDIKHDIRTKEAIVEVLEKDMSVVSNEYTVKIIYNEIRSIKRQIGTLEQYNLI